MPFAISQLGYSIIYVLAPSIANRRNPARERVNVSLEFRRRRHRRAGRSGFVVAGKPCRALRHGRFDGLTILRPGRDGGRRHIDKLIRLGFDLS